MGEPTGMGGKDLNGIRVNQDPDRRGPHEIATGPLTDEALGERLRDGDRAAFDELVRRCHRRVRTICRRMVRSVEESEDLSQETFLRMYRYRHTYQMERKFTSWLDKICVNVCLRHKERNQKRDAAVVHLGDRDVSNEGPAPLGSENLRDPEALARVSELKGQIHDALQSLAPSYRFAIVLRVFSGLSYQEIAEALDCSIGTVMSRINRARTKLRDRLKGRV